MEQGTLTDAYRKALDWIHKAMKPIDGTTQRDPTGVGGRVGGNEAKREAQRALDDAEKAKAEGE